MINNINKSNSDNIVIAKGISKKFQNNDIELDVLKNLDFKIKAGETIAVVGRTGSGKTTLINLITRFYDSASGRILINGIDIKTEIPTTKNNT